MLKIIQLRLISKSGAKVVGFYGVCRCKCTRNHTKSGAFAPIVQKIAILTAKHGAKCRYLGCVFALGDRKMT